MVEAKITPDVPGLEVVDRITEQPANLQEVHPTLQGAEHRQDGEIGHELGHDGQRQEEDQKVSGGAQGGGQVEGGGADQHDEVLGRDMLGLQQAGPETGRRRKQKEHHLDVI